MTTEAIMVQQYRTIILHIFCLLDDSLPDIPRHSQAKLYPSELVTIGILFALRGGFFRAFYRWLKRDYGPGSVTAACRRELDCNVYSRLTRNGGM